MDNITLKCNIEAGVPNKNGIIYTKDVCNRIVDQINTKGATGTLLGCLGFSKSDKLMLSEASHIVTKAEMINKKITVDIKCLNNARGNLLKKMLDQKFDVTIDISGIGSVRDRMVQDDFRINGLDCNIK